MDNKALVLASVASMIDQFNLPNISILQSLGYQVNVVADFTNPGTITEERATELNNKLINMGVRVFDIAIPRSINPDLIKAAYIEVKKIITKEHYSLLHCHSPIGGAIARFVAHGERRKGLKVIYTAHGFHFYTGAPLKNWLLYYPVEWLCAHWTDVLITINKEDYERAKKHMHAKRVEYVPGVGIDTKRFMNATVDRAAKRREIGVPEDATLLMSVGELNENKNHSVVIKALAKLNDKSVHYAIAGNGPLKASLEVLAESLGVGEQLHLLGYRRDVPELYKAADICMFPSIREGQGLAALEGMAAGLPIIASDNRGTRDILTDKVNALICRCDDVDGFIAAISRISTETALREKMAKANQSICTNYDVTIINKQMREIYGFGH